MTPIRELQQFRKDCKRFQEAISKVASDEKVKGQLTSLYKDFLIKAAAVDRSIEAAPAEFKEIAFTHKHLVSELTQSRLAIENFIKKNVD